MKKIFTLFAVAFLATTAFAQASEILVLNATPVDGYALSSANITAKFVEYADSVVIKNIDGREGNNISLTWTGDNWTGINGASTAWVYIDGDPTYYGATLYAGYAKGESWSNCIGGSWNENGGSIWINGYFYKNDQSSDWTYLYYTLTPVAATGISNVSSQKATSVKRLTNRGIVVVKDGKSYDLLGKEIK